MELRSVPAKGQWDMNAITCEMKPKMTRDSLGSHFGRRDLARSGYAGARRRDREETVSECPVDFGANTA